MGYVDTKGNVVIKPQYDGASIFSEGLAFVSLNGKVGYIDEKGKLVIEPQYEGASNFENGYARIYEKHKMGYIDRKGNYIWNPTDATLATELCTPPF